MANLNGAFIHRQRELRRLAWEEINEAGAYVEVSTGKLYRIPQENLAQGASPLMREDGEPVSPLVQLSKNPFIFALAARMLCVEQNIRPDF
jgi:hypothetical protein